MKFKTAIFSILFLSATAASAFELGINGGERFAGTDRSSVGITLGKKSGDTGFELAYDQFRNSGIEQERYSVLGTVDITKVGPIVLTAKGGAGFINNRTGSDGYAWLVGAGASYSITKSVALTADYRYQLGQSRIDSFDGSSVNAGVKFAF